MKTSEQIAENVLRRKEEHNTSKYKKSKITAATLSAAACLSLGVFGVASLAGRDVPTASAQTSAAPATTAEDLLPLYTEHDIAQTSPTISEHEQSSAPTDENAPIVVTTGEPIEVNLPTDTENSVYINKVEIIGDEREKMLYALLCEDFVEMTGEQRCEYYDTNIFPVVPTDLEEAEENQNGGIYRRDNGKGEVYHDTIYLNYGNNDFTREVNVTVSLGRLPFSCFAFEVKDFAPSVINGTEVGIALSDSGIYYAEFIYKTAGFRICAYNLTEAEFVEVISSLIQ